MIRNAEQIKFWDNEGGEFWAGEAEDLDQFLAPLNTAILKAARLDAQKKVLDVGCGPGALTIAASQQAQSAVGVDLSSKLIELAKIRADKLGAKARFVAADAAVYSPPAPVDMVLSRIGIMFFDQPVEAFSHLRQIVNKGGGICFAAWAAYPENPWIMEARAAIQPLLANPLPVPQLGQPGPFSLSDPDQTQAVLELAGWQDVSIKRWQNELGVPASSAEEAAKFFAKICPPARSAANQGVEETAIISQLTDLYQTKLRKEGRISVQGSVWIVKAKAK